jgi:hypothetical protein
MSSRFHPLVVAASLVACIALIPTAYVVTGFMGVPGTFRWRAAMLTAVALVMLGNIVFPVIWNFVQASTNATNWFTQKQGDKRVGISHVESMIAAGRYDDAAAEIDALLALHGLDKGVCLLAVDLHMGKFGSPARAEVLLRRLRAERPVEWERFATQRLIDLYLARTEWQTKAMTELRRMVARFPDSPEASGARACLERLRQEHGVALVPEGPAADALRP